MPENAELPEQLSPEAWSRRYDAATRALNDTAHIVSIARDIRALAAHPDAAVEIMAGGEHLLPVSSGRLALFAGTFNPLTLAHCAVIEAARREVGIDQVLLLSAVASIDKETVARATLADRLAQLMEYVAASPGVSVALVNRGLYADQVAVVRSRFAQAEEIVVLVGYDKIVQIFDPRYYADRKAVLDALFGQARILVAPRLGADRAELERLLAQPENRRYADRVAYLPVPAVYSEDSSTEARRLAASDGITDDLRRTLPPEGAALALETRAYGVALNMRSDYYGWRSAWVKALTASSDELAAHSPSLDRLCVAAMAADERGERLRAILLAEAPDGFNGRAIASLLAMI